MELLFSNIPSILGITLVLTTVYSIYLKVPGILVSAKNYSLGTPHSSDLSMRGRKFCWNSLFPTNFRKSSVCFKI